MTTPKPYKLALIEWSHLIEDFLDNIGLSLDDFINNMTGGWLFGYIEALKTAGVETVLFCFSQKVNAPLHAVHKPSGASLCIIPAPSVYRLIRKVIVNPYTTEVNEAADDVKGWKRWWTSFLLYVAPYCATPLLSLYQQVKKYQCTVMLCQDYEHARFDICLLLGKLLRLPVFASFQGGNWQVSRAERYIRPLTIKACKGLIVGSGVELKRLKEKYSLPNTKMKQIFNPVDLTIFTGSSKCEARKALEIKAEKLIVIWHGRIDFYRKGLDVLIDAWEKVCSEMKEEDIELLLLGSGVNADMLQQRLAKSSVRNIRWINEYTNDRRRIYTYLMSADIYVFPSRNEGFPLAPIEAMACGLPLVAADAPGMSEILQQGENSGGVLLRREDTVAFATAILHLLQDKDKREKLGRLAACHIQQYFSLHTVGRQLKQFLFYDEN